MKDHSTETKPQEEVPTSLSEATQQDHSSKSNAIDIPTLSLPKGGGAVQSIDEKFSVNGANGTAALSIPIPVSNARGIMPQLNLQYDSGSGNGVFGLGWQLDLPSIQRKTDKGLPKYRDADNSDVFMFSGSEDLVPVLETAPDGSFIQDVEGNYSIKSDTSGDGLFTIHYYRPRVENLFAKIERWTAIATGKIQWKVTNKNNETTLYGWSDQSTIADPKNPLRIFKWLPEFSFDDKGNCCFYRYKKEDADGLDIAQVHNQNRVKSATESHYTNTYLSRIFYGNQTAYTSFGNPYPADSDYLFETIFDYGEFNTGHPIAEVNSWDFRSDAFSSYRSGFEIRTTRLCERILLMHHFTGDEPYDGMVKSLAFTYDTGKEKGFTYLTDVTEAGHILLSNGTYSSKNLPPLHFEYQDHQWNTTVQTIDQSALENAPSGLNKEVNQFIDLFGEGLSGILSNQAEGVYYKRNLGNGAFAPAQSLGKIPTLGTSSTPMRLTDLEANGQKQLLIMEEQQKGYFGIDEASEEWQHFQYLRNQVNVSLEDPNVKWIDLTGDGKPDLVVAEEYAFRWYASLGKMGHAPSVLNRFPISEEEGPTVVFFDAEQSVFLADFSGDGLTDIVRIRNGQVVYWPNLGYGNFGKKITMDHAPVFDHAHAFNPKYLKLADIDGSGTTDIVYLGKETFTCWLNLNGNALASTPFEIAAFPEIQDRVQVQLVDLLGNGVPCIVWSSDLQKDAASPMRYIDLMGGRKPHVLSGYANNKGKEVSIEYTPSTHYYLEDQSNARPWHTKLPMVVHCVSKTTSIDQITGRVFSQTYAYHDGYYDHKEREFRGFGMVEQTDSESFEHWKSNGAGEVVDATLFQAPVTVKNWYHTGAWPETVENNEKRKQTYWYNRISDLGVTVPNLEKQLDTVQIIAAPEMAPGVLDALTPEETIQAYRACKSFHLRREIFANDAAKFGNTEAALITEATPYTVLEQNCMVEILQPKGPNQHAVYVVKERETLTYNYERNYEDPRISHSLNLELDQYGNILKGASIVYPRVAADITLPLSVQEKQDKTICTYTENKYTNDVITNQDYRIRQRSETKTYELKGVSKSGEYFTSQDFGSILDFATEIAYHESVLEPLPGSVYKRTIEHVRHLFYANNLLSALPLHQLESLAIPYENYQLAYTPELIQDIYGTKVIASTLIEGKFMHFDGDDNWWIRSGLTLHLSGAETEVDARQRFYVPMAYEDQFGAQTMLQYYQNSYLLVERTEDAYGNSMKVERFNMRTLEAERILDLNGNISEALFDELGMIKAIAVMGKGAEADDLTGLQSDTDAVETALEQNYFLSSDSATLMANANQLLQHATQRYVYDPLSYLNSGKPCVVSSILREEHYVDNANARVQVQFEYLDGSGETVMTKLPAEPGEAKVATINPDLSYSIATVDTAQMNPVELRWVGDGRVVLNNKGNIVKKYQPYFSVHPHFEDNKALVETGVTPLLYYDSANRLVKTELPDGTFSKRELDAWKQSSFDAVDTILDSDWYFLRTNRLIDAALTANDKDPGREKLAADAAAALANTPGIQHLDPLGRAVLYVTHNVDPIALTDELYHSEVEIDTEGHLNQVIDARTNVIMQYKYDMLGHKVYQNGADAGRRWQLLNATGSPLRTWDDRGFEMQYFYDLLQRPLYSKVIGGDGPVPLDNTIGKVVYAESLLLPGRSNEASLQADNVLGEAVLQLDTAGKIETPAYDFKGNALRTIRTLFKKYKEVPNWTESNTATDLEASSFTFQTSFDAFDRVRSHTTPDGSITYSEYNEAGLLFSQSVVHAGTLVPSTYIKEIQYDENGQRKMLRYGNNVQVRFYYDTYNFRLNRLTAIKGDGTPLQDWYYTYDPVGNIAFVEDKNIPVTFFNNHKTTGVSSYTYDALYRLIESTGRENNSALSFGSSDNWNDQDFMEALMSGDAMSVRNYVQRFRYDSVGNIQEVEHQSPGNNWTRTYSYETNNNRLKETTVGGSVFAYSTHAQHGMVTSMPHLPEMGWNFKDELVRTSKQVRNDGGTPERTYYQYDADGNRIRKITELQADPGVEPVKKCERIYLGAYEWFQQYSGAKAGSIRESLSLMDREHRFVIIETRNSVEDDTELFLVRYQLSNYLGSASLELDQSANTISYEEFHAYGTTAYQAINAAIRSAAKRYRYSGMERDTESGLSYHGARYYVPWLARWSSPDPKGLGGGANLYAFVSGNPIKLTDPSGQDGWDRFWGGVRAVGGAVQIGLGVAGIVAPEPATTVVGVVAVAHGADDLQAGLRQLISGEQTRNITEQAAEGAALAAGADEDTARMVGVGTDMALGFVAPSNAPAATARVTVQAPALVENAATGTRQLIAVEQTVSVTVTATQATTAVGTTQGIVHMANAANGGGGPTPPRSNASSGRGSGSGRSSGSGSTPRRSSGSGGGSGRGGGGNGGRGSGGNGGRGSGGNGGSGNGGGPNRPSVPSTAARAANAARYTEEAATYVNRTKDGLTALTNRIKGMGQGRGATVEIALARLKDGRRVLVAGINSSASWTKAQLDELARLGIEVAPKTGSHTIHAEENIAAHIQSLGGRGERWSRGVVGRFTSSSGHPRGYVCSGCQGIIRSIGGRIEGYFH